MFCFVICKHGLSYENNVESKYFNEENNLKNIKHKCTDMLTILAVILDVRILLELSEKNYVFIIFTVIEPILFTYSI